MKIRSSLLAVLLIASQFGGAQDFLTTSGKEIVDESGNPYVLKGMGLGGWMLQEGYMLQTAEFAGPQHQIRNAIEELIGEEDTQIFYDAWLANHVTRRDIDSLKSWGFNSVRLPMHYNLYTLPIEEEPVAGEHTWLEVGFALTDSLISWCKANDMYVILDLHGAPGGQGYDEAISDYDTSKPSLWESTENKAKTVALWGKLAEKYVDEPTVAGYDLLNETNWDLPGGSALKSLYLDITTAIREVDTKHIIFIEGNWFANDFTGLTPPWDDNIVYSPHKYWSTNDQASIQWVLTMRDEHNVPLYLGETGENSNVWFRDAVRLFDEHNIGWAWWPMKKVESISGPLTVNKSADYQTLLDYWNNGGTKPSVEFAKATLMQFAEDLKIENCKYQPDVIDALFRQVEEDTKIPYTENEVPGVVYSTDYDLGSNGVAYFDRQDATYHVSTGNYTAWNNGWAYRNDGVDIEKTLDDTNSNGFNVGWIEKDEWMKYTLDVKADAVYDINVRVASNDGGSFHFLLGDTPITSVVTVPNTGGWQTWQTVSISDVVLSTTDKELTYFADAAGVNLGSFEFVQKGSSSSVATTFVSLETAGANQVKLSVNKSLEGSSSVNAADFELRIDGSVEPLADVTFEAASPRTIWFTVDREFKSSQEVRLSYTGSSLKAADGTIFQTFQNEVVSNKVPIVHQLPTQVEAEDFFFESGTALEASSDEGEGQNVGFLDVGDYMDYFIEVKETTDFKVTYRTASESGGGGVQLRLIEDDVSVRIYHTALFPSTGGWQTWTSTTKNAEIEAGIHHIRVVVAQANFNLNWIRFSSGLATGTEEDAFDVRVFPNPSTDSFKLSGQVDSGAANRLFVLDLDGRVILVKNLATSSIEESIDLSGEPAGIYLLKVQSSTGTEWIARLVKR